VSDIDTAVVDGLKVLDPNGRLEKLPRQPVIGEAEIDVVDGARSGSELP